MASVFEDLYIKIHSDWHIFSQLLHKIYILFCIFFQFFSMNWYQSMLCIFLFDVFFILFLKIDLLFVWTVKALRFAFQWRHPIYSFLMFSRLLFYDTKAHFTIQFRKVFYLLSQGWIYQLALWFCSSKILNFPIFFSQIQHKFQLFLFWFVDLLSIMKLVFLKE